MRILLAALLATACAPATPECVSTTECGMLQACLAGSCEEVACRGSSDCALQTFCDLDTYTCEPGCSTSDDCFIGDRCDVTTATCVARECRNTQLDCYLGERCNTATGACEVDPAPYCRRCSSSEQCGGGNAVCGQLRDSGPGYCFLECSPEAVDPCPAGLQCSAQVTQLGEPDGFRCVGLCDEG